MLSTDHLYYPVPLKENGLIEDYETGAHSYDIPQKTIDLEIEDYKNKLKAKLTFNPYLKFDPEKHFIFKDEYYKSTKVLTMDDLKMSNFRTLPFSQIGAVYPFPLLSQEAIDMVMWESLQPQVLERWGRLPNLSKGATRLDFHIGGHIKDAAPFSWALFNSPKLSEIVSTFTGVKMEPVYDTDKCHLNVSLASLDQEETKKVALSKDDMHAEWKQQNEKKAEDIPSTLGLHFDSVQIAFVIMLDIGDDAVGGETVVVTGDDKTARIPDPKVGYGALIQGMNLKHVATKPVSNSNRITSVTGFGLAGPEQLDDVRMTSAKPSVLPRTQFSQYYTEWFDFKFRHLEAHLRWLREQSKEKYERGEKFDQVAMMKACGKIEKYVHKSWIEMEASNNPPYPPSYFGVPYSELPGWE